MNQYSCNCRLLYLIYVTPNLVWLHDISSIKKVSTRNSRIDRHGNEREMIRLIANAKCIAIDSLLIISYLSATALLLNADWG